MAQNSFRETRFSLWFHTGFSVFVKSPVSVAVSDPEMMQKDWKSLPNGRQQTPKGRRAKRASPLGAPPKAAPCCLPFDKDFLCIRCISGAETGTDTGDFTKTLKPGMKPETETGLPE